MSTDCMKSQYNGDCCCNCKNHYEDFYHCTTHPKPENVEGCVCAVHKGWICLISFEGEKSIARSNWGEHGICDSHRRE